MNFAREHTRKPALLARAVIGALTVMAIGVLASSRVQAAGSLSFTENVGQHDAAVKYRADAGGTEKRIFD